MSVIALQFSGSLRLFICRPLRTSTLRVIKMKVEICKYLLTNDIILSTLKKETRFWNSCRKKKHELLTRKRWVADFPVCGFLPIGTRLRSKRVVRWLAVNNCFSFLLKARLLCPDVVILDFFYLFFFRKLFLFLLALERRCSGQTFCLSLSPLRFCLFIYLSCIGQLSSLNLMREPVCTLQEYL